MSKRILTDFPCRLVLSSRPYSMSWWPKSSASAWSPAGDLAINAMSSVKVWWLTLTPPTSVPSSGPRPASDKSVTELNKGLYSCCMQGYCALRLTLGQSWAPLCWDVGQKSSARLSRSVSQDLYSSSQRTPPGCLGNRAQSPLVLCLLSLIEFPPAPFSRHPTTRTGQQSQSFGARESRPQAVLE